MSNLTVFNQTLTAAKTQDYLAQVLGDKKQSFVNNLTALVANNATLQECEPITLMYAGIKATALDLPLDANLGFAYVIPFRDNKQNKTLAQFQIGYRGFLQLAQRSGLFKTINVRDVREGEIIEEDFISGEIQFQKLKENRETAKIIGYVAYFKLNNGFEKMSYWSVAEIEAHGKKYSQTFKKGFGLWKDNFEAMATKTVLKLLLAKYAPLSVEMQGAITSDQAVISSKKDAETNTTYEEVIYVDNGGETEIEVEDLELLFQMKKEALSASEIKDAERIISNKEKLNFKKLLNFLQDK